MSCFDEIYGNEYYDFIAKNREYLPKVTGDVCTLDGGNNFTILFASAKEFPPLSVANYKYNAIPKCYFPLSLEALEASGIWQIQQNPGLSLDGKGVLLGFLDSGIDALHPAFLDEAGQSRVVAVWNQNYQENRKNTKETEGPMVSYGSVYYGKEVSVYGNGDATGHGTYVASVAAGSPVGNNRGAAPGADIAMVHLKEAKRNLKEFYYIPHEAVCYEETDILMGVAYLVELAHMRRQPLVLCIALGTMMGDHNGNGPLEQYLGQVAKLYRHCVVCGTGNEAARRLHFYGTVEQEVLEVELVVEKNVEGFVLEQWAEGFSTFRIELISPGGKVLPTLGIWGNTSQSFSFPLENTLVSVDYNQPEEVSGRQLIYYRFSHPAEGNWRIRVYNDSQNGGSFHMYLVQWPNRNPQVVFLTPNPDTTITDPGNVSQVLTVGGYQQRQKAPLLESGRGYTLGGGIKPDVVAPAYLVDGAVAGSSIFPEEKQYEPRTGTSGAAALAAGGAALMLQWSQERGDYLMSTTQIKTLWIKGAKKQPQELYPNRQWGYGSLDVYESFRLL